MPLLLPWTLLLAAVLAHLPALASYFAWGDWLLLARGAGRFEVEGWPPLAFQTAAIWRLLWPVFGLESLPYRALALLLNVLVAWLGARVALRLGLGVAGATVAGLVLAVTPLTILPIAWLSAAGELWATLFALVALDVWMTPRTRFAPFVALAFAALALLSSVGAVALALPFAAAMPLYRPEEDVALRRARVVGLVLLGLGAAVAWPGVQDLLGGQGFHMRHGLDLTGWMTWPGRPMLEAGPLAMALGAIALFGSCAVAAWRWRAGHRGAAFAVLWMLATLLPWCFVRERALHPHQALLAAIGWSWILGSAVDGVFGDRPRRAWGWAVAVAVVLTAIGFGVTRSTVTGRGEDGRLQHPVLRAGSVAAHVARTIHAIPDLEQRGGLVVLQATRETIPEDIEIPEGTELRIDSPLHAAVRGQIGLRLLVPDAVPSDWRTDLGELPLSSVVFLDAGEDRLRSLGDLTNARMYAALIAVAAGQYDRARHELWLVLSTVGAQVRFAFDPESMPITPQELDAEAPDFARWLLEDEQPSSPTVLRLFAQLYEAVRGRELLRDPLREPARAPRED